MGGEVLWLPGYGRSEVARVGPQSEEMLRLELLDHKPAAAPELVGGADDGIEWR
jgi:hypothetical protein